MDCAEIVQDGKPFPALVSAPSSANSSPESCTCVAASFPWSSSAGENSCGDSIVLCLNPPEHYQPAPANQLGVNTCDSPFVSSPSPTSFALGDDGPLFLSCAVKAPPSKLKFMQRFVNTLTPQLKKIHSQSSSISSQAKFTAVKMAADTSLAVSARANCSIWSKALLQELSNSGSLNVGARKIMRWNAASRTSYASVLRRCSSSHGSCMRNSRASSATTSLGTARIFPFARQGSHSKCAHASSSRSGCLSNGCWHAVCCRKSFQARRVRRAVFKRHRRSGLSSYLNVLRNSRAITRPWQANAESSNVKVSNMQTTPQISKEQIASLGGLVPGGWKMDVPLLLKEAADYILSLQMQVEALQTLSNAVLL